jgi:magnesium transporter
MAKKNNRRKSKKPGLPPGSLVYTGQPKDRKAGISILSYNADEVAAGKGENFSTVLTSFSKNRVNWINIDTLHDIELIEEIGNHFSIHSLVLEDVLNVNHAPKIVEYDDHLFVILKLIRKSETGEGLEMEHFSILLGDHYLISFQESTEDPFDGIRDRIINNKGKVRGRHTDYLFFLLTDTIIDQYTEVMDDMISDANDLEVELLENFNQGIVNKIIFHKKQLGEFRKTISPVADSYKTILTSELSYISREYINYFRDTYDHLKQISESINSHRDMLNYLMDFNMSQVSNQMNQVMKTLTVIATIFIPLTFVAGIYGMNFDFMPELAWKWSYPVLLFLMSGAGLGMFFYMRRKRWF